MEKKSWRNCHGNGEKRGKTTDVPVAAPIDPWNMTEGPLVLILFMSIGNPFFPSTFLRKLDFRTTMWFPNILTFRKYSPFTYLHDCFHRVYRHKSNSNSTGDGRRGQSFNPNREFFQRGICVVKRKNTRVCCCVAETRQRALYDSCCVPTVKPNQKENKRSECVSTWLIEYSNYVEKR